MNMKTRFQNPDKMMMELIITDTFENFKTLYTALENIDRWPVSDLKRQIRSMMLKVGSEFYPEIED